MQEVVGLFLVVRQRSRCGGRVGGSTCSTTDCLTDFWGFLANFDKWGIELSNLGHTHDLSVTVFTSRLSHAGKTILKKHWKNVVIESNPVFCRIIQYQHTVWLLVSRIHKYRYRNPKIYSPILHVNLIFLGKVLGS